MLVCVKKYCNYTKLLDTGSMSVSTILTSALSNLNERAVRVSGECIKGVSIENNNVVRFNFEESRKLLVYLGINPKEYGL